MTDTNQMALDARARRAAKRAGLLARKSRQRETLDNFGAFMLVDADSGYLVAGARFDMTAQEVIEWCKS